MLLSIPVPFRHAASLLAVGLLLVLGSCSSGGSSSGSSVTQGCGNTRGNVLCLTSCNLGCTTTGCSVSDIAVNQPIILNFNQRIDPASVHSGSVSFRTASGGQPVGDYVVTDQTIMFVPDIKIVGNSTSFGFDPGQRYALTLPGGPNESEGIRSASGDKLAQTVSCFLNATKGVQDLDGKPPQAALVSPVPNSKARIPNLSTFVVEFSEIVDQVPFRNITTSNGPVTFTLFQTQKDSGGNLLCLTKAYEIAGRLVFQTDRIRQRSSLIMQPDGPLPSEVCVVVEVTTRVRDLSNKPAERTVFRVFTETLPPDIQDITESFQNTAKMDPFGTAAQWGGGKLEPGYIGGRGEHGDFVAADGKFLGETNGVKTYEWSTTRMLIPARRNYRNQDLEVTTGIFKFSSFVINSNERVVWEKGTMLPVQIFVRGKAKILGILEVNGTNTPGYDDPLKVWDGTVTTTGGRGEPGVPGGPGGAAGGTGGDRPSVVGGSLKGRNGADVIVHGGPGHPYYATRDGTGGRGSSEHPPGAQTSLVQTCYFNAFSLNMASGGSGGSLFEDDLGTVGKVVRRHDQCTVGADTPPGTAMQLLPAVPSFGSRMMYMLGGSGGGGAGISPYFSAPSSITWKTGAAGAGGGGVLVLRVGGDLEIGSSGKVLARGGNSGQTKAAGYAAPGGGGSGGSVLIQCGSSNILQAGTVDVKGGLGGWWQDLQNIPGVPGGNPRIEGGNGGAGYARLEAVPAPSPSQAGVMLPPASDKNVGLLTDRDFASGAQSLWYHTGKTFPPKYLRYEIEAEVNGVPKRYSDDPRFGPDGPGTGFDPIAVFFQGAEVSRLTNEPDQRTIGKWIQSTRELEAQSPTGFRWMIIFDREFLGPNVPIVIKKVKVVVEG